MFVFIVVRTFGTFLIMAMAIFFRVARSVGMSFFLRLPSCGGTVLKRPPQHGYTRDRRENQKQGCSRVFHVFILFLRVGGAHERFKFGEVESVFGSLCDVMLTQIQPGSMSVQKFQNPDSSLGVSRSRE